MQHVQRCNKAIRLESFRGRSSKVSKCSEGNQSHNANSFQALVFDSFKRLGRRLNDWKLLRW